FCCWAGRVPSEGTRRQGVPGHGLAACGDDFAIHCFTSHRRQRVWVTRSRILRNPWGTGSPARSRRREVRVFGVTIDREARQYLPHLFGRGGYAIVNRPEHLALALPGIYRQIVGA
ncbi:MAG: hypothetical protein EA420_17630, partial [Candidatus Competibacteraceae bacterium]